MSLLDIPNVYKVNTEGTYRATISMKPWDTKAPTKTILILLPRWPHDESP